MKINKVRTNLIKPYWNNARDNTATIEPLKKSIQEFGFNQPLVLDQNNTVIVGHARLRAAKELGMKTIPCIISDMDEIAAKKYRIADNKIQEFTQYKHDELMKEIRELGAENMQDYFNFDLSEMLGNSVGVDIQQVTADQVEKKEGELKGTYKEITGKAADEEVELICPHCKEEFFMKKRDLQ